MSTHQIIAEGILPSGRAIRFKRVDARFLMDLIVRVGTAVGDAPDPGQARLKVETMKETVADRLKAITRQPLAWKYLPSGEPDVDGMLNAVPETAWTKLSYQDLVTDGELSMFELFSDPGEWSAVHATIGAASNLSMGLKGPFVPRSRTRSVSS